MNVLSFTICLMLLFGFALSDQDCDFLDEIDECDATEYLSYKECINTQKLKLQQRKIACLQGNETEPCPKPCDLKDGCVQSDNAIPIELQELQKLQTEEVLPPQHHRVKPLERIINVSPNEVDLELNPNEEWNMKKVGHKLIIQGDGDDESFQYNIPANITTIIKLTNIVNNTNVVNVPTNVNTTNINNIHLYANASEAESQSEKGGKFNMGHDENGPCCSAVRPKSCHASSNGYRCHHKRFKTCGPQCTSKIIHVQARKKCHSRGCQHKMAYVPQPKRPTCVYINHWPYVACGGVANVHQQCEGCYDHYGYGFENFHGPKKPNCFGCYDDGYEYGQMLQRGPVMRPSYYHEPPCYLSGTCDQETNDCEYGCFGHEMIDPAWGPHNSNKFEPKFDEDNVEYVDDDIDNSINGTDSDWGVPIHKCAVISEDNTISIQNCTVPDTNPYAAAPANYPYYPPINYNEKGHRRKPHLRHEKHNEFSENKQNFEAKFVVEDDAEEFNY